MSIIDIEAVLPHRYPFVMVDTVIKFEKNKHLYAYKNISRNEPCLQGHFPNQAIFPGVLIIEALAQASGILLFTCDHKEEYPLYYLAGTEKTRFKRKVVPGDQLLLEVKLLSLRNNFAKVSSKASVAGDLVCSTDILLMCEAPSKEKKINHPTICDVKAEFVFS